MESKRNNLKGDDDSIEDIKEKGVYKNAEILNTVHTLDNLKETKLKERNISIDILKTLGILCIILAHVNPPNMIFQIRNFDVSLMVILAAFLGKQSYNKNTNHFKYLAKRIMRLVLPVWIFLTIFFGVMFSLNFLGFKINILDFKKILESYLLLDGIGYVWIIRVYILCCIGMLILIKASKIIKPTLLKIILVFVYIAYEILYYFIEEKNFILEYFIYNIIPYGIVCTYIGLELKNMSNKKILKISLIMISIFIILATYFSMSQGHFVITNNYKYPPRLYYLSYAIGISLLLYYLIDRKNIFNIKKRLNNSIIIFISSHSMWIYLWHILFIFIINKIFLNINFIIKYITVLIGAILVTYLQTTVIKMLKIKNKTILSIING